MTTAVPRRTQLILLGAIGAIVAVGLLYSTLTTPPRGPATARVASLEEAVAIDILDREVLDDLRAEGAAVGHVSLDLNGLIAALERTFPDLAAKLGEPDRIAAIDRALAEAKAQLRRAIGEANVLSDFDGFPVVAIRFEREADLLAAVRLPVVASIRADGTGNADVVQSKAIVRAGEVHDQGFEGQGTYVAVLDTGVDPTGYEQFFPSGSLGESYRAKDPEEGDADGSATPEGHGTHVSSTVLAMAPRTRILPIEVFRVQPFLEDGEIVYDAVWSDTRLRDGIRHVIELKRQYIADQSACCNVVAMNMSLGKRGVRNQTVCTDDFAFRLAWEVGIVPVTSAGNSALQEDSDNPGTYHFVPGVGFLACNPYALNVGATTDGVFPEFRRVVNGETTEYCGASTAIDRPTDFSQTGPLLKILAPGNCIVAATGASQGTSMAAPHAAGAVAALVSAKPDASPEQIVAALTGTGTPIEDTRTDPSTIRNRLDMADALAALRSDDVPVPTSGPILGRIIAVALEPDQISPSEALTRGDRHALERIGVWNRGMLTNHYELVVTDSGLDLGEAAPPEWFTLDPASFTLDPGQGVVVQPGIDVPSDARPGAYAARIETISDLRGLTDSVLVTFEVAGAAGGGGGGLATGEDEPSGIPIAPLVVVGLLALGLVIWLGKRGRRTT